MTISDGNAEPSYMTPALAEWRRRTDFPLLVLAVGTLPLLLLELARHRLIEADRIMLDVVGVLVLVAFAVDLVVEAALSRDTGLYLRDNWMGLLVVVAQAVALLPALTAVGVLRALRAGRVVALYGALYSHGRQALAHHAAKLALGAAAMVWLTSAVVFTLVEDVGETGRVHSFFDALWWSTATITTVGYGDVAPVTVVGRIAGMVTMVVGISAFAIVTARIAEFLVRADLREAGDEDAS